MGLKYVSKLNGMWLFAIYDKLANRVVFVGIVLEKSHCFILYKMELLHFLSELHSLKQHAGIKTSNSAKALQKYFAYGYIPAPHTIYENCFKCRAVIV